MIKELDGHCTIYVGLCGGKENNVLVGDTDVGNSIHEEDGVVPIFFGGDDLRAVVLDFRTKNVVLESSIDEYLALDVDEDDRTNHEFKIDV